MQLFLIFKNFVVEAYCFSLIKNNIQFTFFAGESRDVETVSPASRRGGSCGGITLIATQVYHGPDIVLLQFPLRDPPVRHPRQLRLPAVLF